MDVLALIADAVPGTDVEIVRIQAAVLDQHGQQSLFVVGGQLVVEDVAVDGLGKQLGDVAALVAHHLPTHHRPAPETLGVVEEGGAVVVGEDLELYAEFLAVAEDEAVVVGNAGRTEVGVHVILAVEVDPLPAVDLVNHVTGAGRQVSAPGALGGLKDRAVIARFR